MKSFKAALIQMKSRVGHKADNLAAMERLALQTEDDVRLILYPELCLTGHAGHKDMISEAESAETGRSVQHMCELAAKTGKYLCFGMAEECKGLFYNTQVVVGPEGVIGKQRKTHLSSDEYYYFRGGNEVNAYDLGFARVGIVICYDNSLPELSRIAAVKGAEVLLCPHASRAFEQPEHEALLKHQQAYMDGWKMLHAVRAGDNNAFVLLTNAAGDGAEGYQGINAIHPGAAMAVDPYGREFVRSSAMPWEDAVTTVELDGLLVDARRKEICNPMRTRRPEVFGVLSEQY